MDQWIKTTGYILCGFGIAGVISNYNWVSIEQRIALWMSIVFLFIAAGISFTEFISDKKR